MSVRHCGPRPPPAPTPELEDALLDDACGNDEEASAEAAAGTLPEELLDETGPLPSGAKDPP